MPVWLTILLSCGGSALIGLLIKDLYEFFKKKSKKAQERLRKDRKELYKEAAEEVVKPLEQKLDTLENKINRVEDNLMLTREGMQSELRHDIRNSCRRCIAQGYRTEDDIQEIDALHTSYEKVGITNGLTNTLYDNFKQLPLVPNDYSKPKSNNNTTRKKKSPTAITLNEGK